VRILHVIQEMGAGGAERIVVSLGRGATATGHAVAVSSAGGALLDELDVERFPLPLLQRRPWRVPAASLALRRAIAAWRPDIVHCHNPGMALVAALPTRRGRRPPALVSVHGVAEEDWAATSRVLRVAGLMGVACGPGVAAALAEHSCSVVTTIPNGVTPAPPAADRDALAREWDLPPGRRLVVAIGRLVPQKNHELAVRALADLPDTTLAILGDGPLRAQLETIARDLGIEDRLVLPGVRPDARAIAGGADAVVFSSVWEGLPLAALEALAAGTPVVATSVRGLRELLTDRVDALVVPPNDPSALAAALREVLGDCELAARLAAGGRALAATNSEEAMVERYLALYDDIVAAA
jgi:glycosyltransferase involved in cell wall biosynthesis